MSTIVVVVVVVCCLLFVVCCLLLCFILLFLPFYIFIISPLSFEQQAAILPRFQSALILAR